MLDTFSRRNARIERVILDVISYPYITCSSVFIDICLIDISSTRAPSCRDWSSVWITGLQYSLPCSCFYWNLFFKVHNRLHTYTHKYMSCPCQIYIPIKRFYWNLFFKLHTRLHTHTHTQRKAATRIFILILCLWENIKIRNFGTKLIENNFFCHFIEHLWR